MQNLEKWKNKIFSCILLSVSVIQLMACSTPQESEVGQQEAPDFSTYYQITDADARTEPEDSVTIDLEQEDYGFTITEPGTYILEGEYGGPIQVDAQDQIVHIILNGVDVSSNRGPAFHVISAGKVVITLAEGTKNTLTDSANYDEMKDTQACLYSISDLTINGEGSLYVYGYYEDAIRSKDVIKILGGDIHIQAKGDGLRGNDGMVVMPESLTMECEKNGIRTTKNGNNGKGFIDICGGNISIISGENGVLSGAELSVRDCKISCNSVQKEFNSTGEQWIEEGCLENE